MGTPLTKVPFVLRSVSSATTPEGVSICKKDSLMNDNLDHLMDNRDDLLIIVIKQN